ncbi:hypothetical protein ES708_10389 [subsurface metagenome]
MISDRIRNIYRRSVHGIRSGATYDALVFPRVELNHYLNIRHVAVWDETTNVVLAVLYVATLGEDWPLEWFQLTDVTQAYVKQVDFWMAEGDRLVVRFYDGAESDLIHAYAYGVEYMADVELGAV